MPKPVFAAPSDEQTGSVLPRRMINPVSSIRSHKVLATFIFLLVLAGGAAFLVWLGPKYTATGTIELDPRPLGILETQEDLTHRNIHEFVSTAVNAIQSRDTFLNAIDNLRQHPFIQEMDLSDAELVGFLAGHISADRIENSYRIAVRASGSEPEGLHHLANAVIDAYLDKSRRNRFPGRDETEETLRAEIRIRETEITNLRSQRAGITARIGRVEEVDEAGNPYSEAMLQAQEDWREARQARVELETRIARLEDLLETPPEVSIETITDEDLELDPYFRQLRGQLNQQRAALKARMLNFGTEHPTYKADQRRITEIDNELAEAEAEARQRAVERRMTNTLATIRANLDNARRDLVSAQEIEESRFAAFTQTQDDAEEFRRQYQEAIRLGERIENTTDRLNRLTERLETLQTEAAGPSDARLGYYAPAVTRPDEKRRILLGLMFFLAAGFLAIVVPTFLDWMDPWIKSPADVESLLRVQPLGWVLEAKNESTRGFARDQMRRLALAIDRQRQEGGRRIFVLTSLKPGGGTTELVLQLARQLDNIGIRALAVETNAYEGDTRFGGETTGPGLGAVLRAEADLANAIRPGDQEEDLPDRIPVGTLEERQIHENGRLLPSLKALEAQYDVFLLDAPPLLVSADAELLCGMADAVLLVVEAEGVTVGELRRAAKQLDQIAPPIMGVIVNRVRIYGTGYFRKLIREYESGERIGGPGLLGKLGLARRH